MLGRVRRVRYPARYRDSDVPSHQFSTTTIAEHQQKSRKITKCQSFTFLLNKFLLYRSPSPAQSNVVCVYLCGLLSAMAQSTTFKNQFTKLFTYVMMKRLFGENQS